VVVVGRSGYMTKCKHDYVFMDKWQDAKRTYWEFHCRFCLEIVVRDDSNVKKK